MSAMKKFKFKLFPNPYSRKAKYKLGVQKFRSLKNVMQQNLDFNSMRWSHRSCFLSHIFSARFFT